MRKRERGRLLWKSLHEYAWAYAGGLQGAREASAEERRAAGDWLAAWRMEVPSWGCACRREWDEALAVCPPALSDARVFWWWTVAAHDRVNARLGKALASPEWSLRHPLLAGVVVAVPAPA